MVVVTHLVQTSEANSVFCCSKLTSAIDVRDASVESLIAEDNSWAFWEFFLPLRNSQKSKNSTIQNVQFCFWQTLYCCLLHLGPLGDFCLQYLKLPLEQVSAPSCWKSGMRLTKTSIGCTCSSAPPPSPRGAKMSLICVQLSPATLQMSH